MSTCADVTLPTQFLCAVLLGASTTVTHASPCGCRVLGRRRTRTAAVGLREQRGHLTLPPDHIAPRWLSGGTAATAHGNTRGFPQAQPFPLSEWPAAACGLLLGCEFACPQGLGGRTAAESGSEFSVRCSPADCTCPLFISCAASVPPGCSFPVPLPQSSPVELLSTIWKPALCALCAALEPSSVPLLSNFVRACVAGECSFLCC